MGGAIVKTGTVQRRHLRPLVRWLDVLGGWILGGSRRRPITVEMLRRTAAKNVGYDDFGITPEYDRAGELLEKGIADHPCSFVGRLATVDTLVRHHQNRLKLRRAMADPPEGVGFKRPPYVVTGLFRSGTTLMHNLLTALPDRDALETWELMCPVPEPGREADAQRMTRSAVFLSPETEAIHPMRWNQPEECWLLMSPGMRCQGWTVVLDIPEYTEWLDGLSMDEPYRDYRAILEYVSAFRDEGLVMKDPGHTPSIGALHRAIPEARIVFMHRDPAKSVASYGSLSAVHHRTYYGSFDPDAVGEKVLGRFARYIEAAREQRPHIDDASILDVDFHEFVDDPVRMIQRIVEHFGDEWTDDAEVSVRTKLEDMPRDKHGKHHYFAAQWGLTADGIRERFSDYVRERELRLEAV